MPIEGYAGPKDLVQHSDKGRKRLDGAVPHGADEKNKKYKKVTRRRFVFVRSFFGRTFSTENVSVEKCPAEIF